MSLLLAFLMSVAASGLTGMEDSESPPSSRKPLGSNHLSRGFLLPWLFVVLLS